MKAFNLIQFNIETGYLLLQSDENNNSAIIAAHYYLNQQTQVLYDRAPAFSYDKHETKISGVIRSLFIKGRGSNRSTATFTRNPGALFFISVMIAGLMLSSTAYATQQTDLLATWVNDKNLTLNDIAANHYFSNDRFFIQTVLLQKN